MISRYTHKNLEWIDVDSPTHEEVFSLMKEFNIHPLIADELSKPSLRPRIDSQNEMLYLILHFPAFKHSHSHAGDHRQEIDFIIGKNRLITVRYDMIDAMHKFSKDFEVSSILDKNDMGDHAGYLFYYLIHKLYKSLVHELEHIESRLRITEAKIFHGQEDRMVAVLSGISRDLLDFKRTLRTHEDVLRSLPRVGKTFFGEEFVPYLESIVDEYHKVVSILDGQKETLYDLRSTNDSLLSAKQGGVMKTLTAITFATFPPAFIAWLFSMRTEAMPLIHRADAFWLIVIGMIVSTLVTLVWFIYKKWL